MIGALTQQPLVASTDIGVGIKFIAEVQAPEQALSVLIIDCVHDENNTGIRVLAAIADAGSRWAHPTRIVQSSSLPACDLSSAQTLNR